MNNKFYLFTIIFCLMLISTYRCNAEEDRLMLSLGAGYSSKHQIQSNLAGKKLIKETSLKESTSLFNQERLQNLSHLEKKVLQTPFEPKSDILQAKIIKGQVAKDKYDTIELDKKKIFSGDMDILQTEITKDDPSQYLGTLAITEKAPSPFMSRLKTVYFLTSLSTGIGQGTQIEDAFTTGSHLTGGGQTLNDHYGYNNVARNFLSPFSRAIKGAKVDDSGPRVNFILHPLFGFGITSYLKAAGASDKEALLVALADNLIFEYVVEGTYVAPSGIDLLATSGGTVLGYLATKYVFKKPFEKIVSKSAEIKEKLHMDFSPIIQPGVVGKGMRFGSTVTFTH